MDIERMEFLPTVAAELKDQMKEETRGLTREGSNGLTQQQSPPSWF